MKAVISRSRAMGRISAPPSKSISHRALICAALSEKSTVNNIDFSEDIVATLNCLEALGAKINRGNGKVEIGGLDVFDTESTTLFCNESGSTLRFLLPLSLLSGKEMKFTGKKGLMARPMDVYRAVFSDKGINFTEENGVITVKGKLEEGEYTLQGNISSQFISGLIFALPLLKKDSKITVTDKFESVSYVDITLDVLNSFGAEVRREENVIYIKGGWIPSSREYSVEGDMSNAAFLAAFNLIGGEVEVDNLDDLSLQGDKVYKRMFVNLKNGIKKYDLSDCPDLAPVAFAMAAVYGGAIFTGTKRLRIKESDRGLAMKNELKKFGIETVINENSIEILKGEIKKPIEALNGHNDHRIVMALALLCTITGGEIEGAEAVKKSFPDFFDKLSMLNVRLELI